MKITITVHRKKISKNRHDLYLEYSPAIIDPKRGTRIKHERLNLFVYDHPKDVMEEIHNSEALIAGETFRVQREFDVWNNNFDFLV